MPPNGLEHPVAGGPGRDLGDDERSFDEPAHAVEGVATVDHAVEVRTQRRTGERRELGERGALAVVEELLGPGDDGGQRAVPVGRPAVRGAEQIEPGGHERGQLRHPHGTDPGGSHLDGEWETVHLVDDAVDRGRVRRVRVEPGRDRPRAVDEELPRRGDVQRGDRPHALAAHAEPLATGREDAHPSAEPEHRLRRGGGRLDQMLAVVEHHQRVEGAEPPQCGQVALDLQIDRAQDRGHDGLSRREGGQVDEERPVRGLSAGHGRDLDRQPRLSDPARTHECHEPRRRQQSRDAGDVVGTTEDRFRRARRALAGGMRDLAHEPVAAAAHVAHQPLPAAVVTDGPAHLLHPGGQRRIRHELIPPHPIEQLLLGHDPAPVLHEVGQQVERLRLEVLHLPARADLTPGEVERATVEPEHQPDPSSPRRPAGRGRTRCSSSDNPHAVPKLPLVGRASIHP